MPSAEERQRERERERGLDGCRKIALFKIALSIRPPLCKDTDIYIEREIVGWILKDP
jgi:hypothetical protein